MPAITDQLIYLRKSHDAAVLKRATCGFVNRPYLNKVYLCSVAYRRRECSPLSWKHWLCLGQCSLRAVFMLTSRLTTTCVAGTFVLPISDAPSDAGFVAMMEAYRATGGIARCSDLILWFGDQQGISFVDFAKRVALREVLAFEWAGIFWAPLFQFEPYSLALRSGPRKVLAEMATAVDGWACTAWFARPNSGLNCSAPVDEVNSNLSEVLTAVRVSKFYALAQATAGGDPGRFL